MAESIWAKSFGFVGRSEAVVYSVPLAVISASVKMVVDGDNFGDALEESYEWLYDDAVEGIGKAENSIDDHSDDLNGAAKFVGQVVVQTVVAGAIGKAGQAPNPRSPNAPS